MPTYNPLDSRFLTTANAITRDGQKFVRIILDVVDNVFYTLDDDGNFNPIGSGGTSSSGVTSINVGTGLSANTTTGAVTIIATGTSTIQGITGITAGVGISANTIDNVTTITNTQTQGITGITANSPLSATTSNNSTTLDLIYANGLDDGGVGELGLGGTLTRNVTIDGNGGGYGIVLSDLSDIRISAIVNEARFKIQENGGAIEGGLYCYSESGGGEIQFKKSDSDSSNVWGIILVGAPSQSIPAKILMRTPNYSSGVNGAPLRLVDNTTGEVEFSAVEKLNAYGNFYGGTSSDGGTIDQWALYTGSWTDYETPNLLSVDAQSLAYGGTDPVLVMVNVAGQINGPTNDELAFQWSSKSTSINPDIPQSFIKIHTMNTDVVGHFSQTFFITLDETNDALKLWVKNITSTGNVLLENVQVTISTIKSTTYV